MAPPVQADPIRVATLHAELTRKGPGLLLRDIGSGKDAQLAALQQVIKAVSPDVLLLTKVDFDAQHRTLNALRDFLGFSHGLTLAPNSMRQFPYDLNGDGRAGDRQSWARYAGEGGMVLLSNHAIELRFHKNDLLWRDVTGAALPQRGNGRAVLSDAALAALKVVTHGLWGVHLAPETGRPMTLVLFQHTTPAFDGEEDFNGLRNLAQLKLLGSLLESDEIGDDFVLMGNTNLDPDADEGYSAEMANFLKHAKLHSLVPTDQTGNSATAFWEKPGARRVSYILPGVQMRIERSGLFNPIDGPHREVAEQASRHRLIWADITPEQR